MVAVLYKEIVSELNEFELIRRLEIIIVQINQTLLEGVQKTRVKFVVRT